MIRAIELGSQGFRAGRIAGLIGVPRSTVRDWLDGRLPSSFRERPPPATPDPALLADSYPYLLGMYLGDGCLSAHRGGVYRLRVTLDARYPGIVEECMSAVADALPRNRVSSSRRSGSYACSRDGSIVEISAYSKRWPMLLPQHGPGRKHQRAIRLKRWQWDAVRADPWGLLRGLIHSDGCRSINTGRNWRHPRYSFSNESSDILHIFCEVCTLAGLHCTRAPKTVYVSRKADVAALDSHVGPKG